MLDFAGFFHRLEVALKDTSGIIVPPDIDEEVYFEKLRNSIRESACEPLYVTATVLEPDYLEMPLGAKISAYVLAFNKGIWLAYEPTQDKFYCFWGTSAENLGAYREAGNPLFCWWD
jgi:hypothetical protein